MVKMYCEDMERATVASGRYLAHEAARLVGVPGERIGQWARWGHISASISDGDPHVYAFVDVAEALAVHLLLEAGFRLPVIRRAVDQLGGPGAHPLSTGALHVVDGRLAVERGEVLEDVFTEQGVLPLDGRVHAAELLRRGGWPARAAALRVEVDPARAGGRPCVRGRRIPVEDVAADPEGAAREYGLGSEDIADAVRWWAEANA
jgi:uncharacterized protein (DUF433 family)